MGFGDDIMSTVKARELRKTFPNGNIMYSDGKTKFPTGEYHWSPIFENNLNITKKLNHNHETIIINDVPGNRPYIDWDKFKKHTKEMKRQKKNAYKIFYKPDFKAEPGDIVLNTKESDWGFNACTDNLILIEPHVKAVRGCTNKDWGFDKYQQVVNESNLKFVQCVYDDVRRLENVEIVETKSFRDLCSVLLYARSVLCPEGGVHHAAAALNKPGAVIFGERISPKATGYDLHTNFYYGDLDKPCGMNVNCVSCGIAMDNITVDEVVNALEEI